MPPLPNAAEKAAFAILESTSQIEAKGEKKAWLFHFDAWHCILERLGEPTLQWVSLSMQLLRCTCDT